MKTALFIMLPIVFFLGMWAGGLLVSKLQRINVENAEDAAYTAGFEAGIVEGEFKQERYVVALLDEASRLHAFIDEHGLAREHMEAEQRR